MFAHTTTGSNDIKRSVHFYDALLAPLGITRRETEIDDEFVCYLGKDSSSPLFFVVAPIDNKPASAGNGSMIAFIATSREQVTGSYQSGIDHGGTDEGPPGIRPEYADDYFGAYLRDPDGNKIHIVCRG